MKNNQAIVDLNKKVSELMSDNGMIASNLASSLVNLFKLETKSQFKLIKDQISIRMSNFLINKSLPGTLYSNNLTFKDSTKSFIFDGDLSETITNFDFKVDLSNQRDRKRTYEFGKEMKLDIKQKGRQSNQDRSLKSLLKSSAILASGISKIFLPYVPNEL